MAEVVASPRRIAALPVCPQRKVPVPWFVAWIEGKPDFRVIGEKRIADAVGSRRCWICGQSMGAYVAYVVSPMCTINRASSEPPSHRDCAVYAAQACPFLTKPHMRRRENSLPDDLGAPGLMLKRNPGAVAVWITRKVVRRADLFDIGEPTEVLWFAEGEPLESIDSGLPALKEMAEVQGPIAVRALHRQLQTAMQYVPPDDREERL